MIILEQMHLDFARRIAEERGVSELVARGKCAARLFLNPVDWHIEHDGEKPDFDDFIDVRVTAESHRGMYITAVDPTSWAYLLICGAATPKFEIVGWLWGREIKHENFVSRAGGYYVPNERGLLRKPDELIAELRRRQNNRAPIATTPTSDYASYWDSDGRLVTKCWICAAPNAGWGYGVSQRRGQPGRWFCFAHRPTVSA